MSEKNENWINCYYGICREKKNVKKKRAYHCHLCLSAEIQSVQMFRYSGIIKKKKICYVREKMHEPDPGILNKYQDPNYSDFCYMVVKRLDQD